MISAITTQKPANRLQAAKAAPMGSGERIARQPPPAAAGRLTHNLPPRAPPRHVTDTVGGTDASTDSHRHSRMDGLLV